MRRAVALLLALLAFAQAQTCRSELERAAVLAGPRPGLRAAALIHEAHRLVEPAFPVTRRGAVGRPALASEAAGFDSVRYLDERRLLPNSWRRDALDVRTWQRMIDRFTRGYGLDAIAVTEPVGLDSMIDDAERALAAVSAAVRPAVLIATDQEDGETLVFLTVLWNWTPYPRLLVFNPEGRTLAEGVESLLAQIGSCALSLDHYILAREETAARLFLGNYSAGVIVVGSDSHLPGRWPERVAAGGEIGVLSFDNPDLGGLAALSLIFDGTSSLGLFDAIGLFARVQTNLSPSGLFYHLALPPAP